jgi:hypothetical protein
MNTLKLLFVFCFSYFISAQELQGTVTINSELVSRTNKQVFKTLENALTNFINNNRWTEKEFSPQERIQFDMFINVSSYDNNQFGASLQVQSSRPVFASTFQTPVFKFKDENFNFSYTEYQPLFFNANSFESNLVSLVSFYVYVILGMNADTFSMNDGSSYFKTAQKIVGLSQQSGYRGWNQSDGRKSRYRLMDEMLSNSYQQFRKVQYQYHRNGLDTMNDNVAEAKESIASTIISIRQLDRSRPNALLTQLFFDTKADEIEQIFTAGPSIESQKDLVIALNKAAPFFATKWANIQ